MHIAGALVTMLSRLVVCVLLASGVSSITLAARAGAQTTAPGFGPALAERDLGRDARLLATNALMGAATASLLQWTRGQPVWPAVRRGALGGAIAYAGKRLVVERWPGAGLAGREVAAAGHSIVRNAAAGRGAWQQLIFPLGPLRVYVRPDSQTRLRARIDAPGMLYALLLGANGIPLDGRASWSSGAVVFRVPDKALTDLSGRCIAGLAFAGIVVLNDVSGRATDARSPIVAHERVHVLQSDQIFASLSEPTKQWLASHARWFRGVKRYADFNVVGLTALVPQAIWGDSTPWEREARSLTRQTFGDARGPADAESYWGCSAPEG